MKKTTNEEWIQIAIDHYGMAVRDNTKEEKIAIGKSLEDGTFFDEENYDAKTEITLRAVKLIEAMIEETEAMPRSWQAPKTVDAAVILRARLEQMGYRFGEGNG